MSGDVDGIIAGRPGAAEPDDDDETPRRTGGPRPGSGRKRKPGDRYPNGRLRPGGAAAPGPEPEPEGPPVDPAVIEALMIEAGGQLVQLPCKMLDIPELDEQKQALMIKSAQPVLLKYLGPLVQTNGPELLLLGAALVCYGIPYLDKQRAERDANSKARADAIPTPVVPVPTGPPDAFADIPAPATH